MTVNKSSGKISSASFQFSDQNWGDVTSKLTCATERHTNGEQHAIIIKSGAVAYRLNPRTDSMLDDESEDEYDQICRLLLLNFPDITNACYYRNSICFHPSTRPKPILLHWSHAPTLSHQGLVFCPCCPDSSLLHRIFFSHHLPPFPFFTTVPFEPNFFLATCPLVCFLALTTFFAWVLIFAKDDFMSTSPSVTQANK